MSLGSAKRPKRTAALDATAVPTERCRRRDEASPLSDFPLARPYLIASAMPDQWTSVQDSLPEPNTDVLVALRYSEDIVITSRHAAHYIEPEGWRQWRGYKSVPIEGEVTHWRPLPNPPE